jgi:hypothetical protein
MFKINLLVLTVLLLLAARAGAAEPIWQEVRELQARSVDNSQRQYQVDNLALRAILQRVTENIGPGSVQIIRLPMPDGSFADFEIFESPVMSDEVAQRYPEIRTFKVYGIDDPIASGRLDMTPQGFHAMLHTSQGRLFIDPHTSSQQADRYQARTQETSPAQGYFCGVDDYDMPSVSSNLSAARTAARASDTFLQYRIAVAATTEYVQRLTGSAANVAQAFNEIVTAIGRVNLIYERELGIQLMLVSDETLIEYGGNVTFSNGDPAQMFIENQKWIDGTIPRYDIGHVFGTGSGGLAWLGAACDRNNKAKGVSGIANPLGDPFYIDFVAHEIGHQFNADHSFNGTTSSCATGRNPATAYEPGSGSTIMSYAGICRAENLQFNSDATFHAGSIAQIDKFTAGAGNCSTPILANPPNSSTLSVSTLASKIIPANTTFELDGEASAADGDTFYQWDQMDVGCPTDSQSFGTDTGYNALFRSYPPRAVPKRHFPAFGTQLNGDYDEAEVLPCNNRDLNFQFSARDKFGREDRTSMRVSVRDTGSAFKILNLNTGQTRVTGETFSVNWQVANTDQPPISCDNVDIDLLTFAPGYTSYTAHPLLAMPTPNIGTADVAITPLEKSHQRARIRVKCSDSVFYDVSDVFFAVDGTDPGPDNFDHGANPVYINSNITLTTDAPACGAVVECEIPDSGGPDSGGSANGGSSAVEYRWLLLLGGILLIARVRRARSA